MWLIKEIRAIKTVHTPITNSDHLMITIVEGCPPGGIELVGSDPTINRLDVLPPILAAPQCAVDFASAI
jgi:hypothetical protein